MRVHILGYYGMKNVGDEAFRPAMSYIFDGHDVKFFNIDVYRSAPPLTPDVLVLGGGDVVTPYYLPVISESKCKIKLGLGVGLGYESESTLAAEANLSGWFLRNHSDVDLVRGQTNVPVQYTPDLAFQLKPTGKKVLRRYMKPGRVVALLLTDYLMPSFTRPEEVFWKRSRAFLEHFGSFCAALNKQGYRILAVPCSGDNHADDRRIHMSLRSFVKGDMTCVPDLLSPQDMIDLLAEVDYTICQRFHSHVFSMIAGRPILSVSFTRKVDKLLEAAGAGVSTQCFDKDGMYVEKDLMGLFDQMTREAEAMSVRFQALAGQNRFGLAEVKQRVLQLIGA